MTAEEEKNHVEMMKQALADILAILSPVTPEDALRILVMLVEKGYSLVPTELEMKKHDLFLENMEKQAFLNKQKDTIIQGQVARIAQLEGMLGIEREDVLEKNPPIMWVSRESA